MKPIIYIDGKEGAAGLSLYKRLGGRTDIELLLIDGAKRKDRDERKKLINAADLVFLCLPDAAAREALALLENPAVRVIDASTAHRTAAGWVYGFPELSENQRAAIRQARLVSNPGCHASGAIALLAPLVSEGILPADYPLAITSLTGYSGGGRGTIADYENPDRPAEYAAPRLYGLTMAHKHLPEITAMAGLAMPPAFTPVICGYYSGMEIIIPLHRRLVKGGKREIRGILEKHYAGSFFIHLADAPAGGYSPSNAYTGTNDMELCVAGSEDMVLLTARFDNLGKGAAGAAVQNMNLMLGFPENSGLGPL
ncbi:MAG: N-acetyl-gamma-glutamyl-phosphate reductase [Treponema sp.]|jgi:N-acetyl-gamma-glutamyl-phosphate reductase|nr:N-acetyl-gamma-glutamyl-phosphate reductase [Treponema sp.]